MVISDDPISVVSDDINITPPIPSGYSSFLDKLKDDMDRIADTINSDTTNPMLSNLDRIANKLNTTSTDPMMSNLDKIAEGIESGGGGSGINNPVLTINVDATGVSGEVGALPLLQINDNDLQTTSQMVVGGTTADYSTIVLNYYENGDSAYIWDGATAYPSTLGSPETLTISDEVNCSVTLDKGEGKFYAMITDPTQPASFTLTIS